MPDLEHDPELIERLASMHEGNAELHDKRAAEQKESGDIPRSGWSQHDMLAASGFAIAASYWSLIVPRNAVRLYRRAAQKYRDLGHSYWMVLAFASASEREIAEIPSSIDEATIPNPQAVAFGMIGNEISGADRRHKREESFDTYWHRIGNPPVGRLGIPLDYYGHCAQAMRAAREKKNDSLFLLAGADYVHRAAEVIRSASHDRYHWLQLQSSILPAEPEAVAMTTAMSMMSHALFETPISKIPNLDSHGRLLVEIGDDLWNAARGNLDLRR